MENTNFQFVKINTPEGRTRFIAAWEEAFARSLDRRVYEWIFHEGNHLYALEEADRVAAGYALLDQPIVYFGERTQGALCNNVFVRPAFQAQNLFVKLSRLALAEAEQRGVRLAIGMPNANAVPGHRRVGWSFLPPIHFLEAEPQTVLKNNPVAPGEEVTVSNFEDWGIALDAFSAQQCAGRSYSVVKTKDYFFWRYLRRPFTRYHIYVLGTHNKIHGFIVFKYFELTKRLHIVDWDGETESDLHQLLAMARRISAPYTLINAWGSTIHKDSLLAAGFRLSEEANNLIAIVPYRKDTVELGSRSNIVLGDNDVF